ncbi:shikimate dehydrogenase [Guptibacillus hwajinpoensis]|uniref:shikimate dehydrogenase n=1 Tax=Guptibacillus hwajinpoensis TaxID=208199 RepID=UPI0018844588|nr:shikimate dehydrogenase [Pseudalkalibacillus hwajinpoensis]MBF0706474.1 shikimate dehydrogenase [Pseudalkalibacillus hwajinpoensis]
MGKLYGLIGHPIGHSMSPIMHNGEFKELGLSHHYHAFDLSPEQLEDGVDAMKMLDIQGFNVTIPHKVAIIPLLDEVEQEAIDIGAVNTVYKRDGKYIGTNTDGSGYLFSLLTLIGEKNLSGKKILVIGAGGAARAVAVSVSQSEVASLTIANRTLEKAEELSKLCQHYSVANAITLSEAETSLGQFDIVINTTSIGMSPHLDRMPISLEHIRSGTVVSDLIYNPLETKWMKLAKSKGAVTDNGISMFVEQGALAFEKWTGVSPDRKRMRNTVLKELGGYSC